MGKEIKYELNESNVIDAYIKLSDKKEIDEKEQEEILKRFFELVNFNNKKG